MPPVPESTEVTVESGFTAAHVPSGCKGSALRNGPTTQRLTEPSRVAESPRLRATSSVPLFLVMPGATSSFLLPVEAMLWVEMFYSWIF